MTTSNKCNHALEIAEDMYNAYADGKDRYKHQPMVKYADLPDDDKAGWLNVAEQALPIIGNHALGDIRDYLGVKASGASTWWKRFCWAWPTPLLVLLVFPCSRAAAIPWT